MNNENVNININMDDVSDEMKPYYASLTQKIIKHIQNNELDQAIELINNEIDSPYTPNSILIMLLETKEELEIQQKHQVYERDLQNCSDLQLWDKIYNPKKHLFDIALFNVFLERKDDVLDELDLSVLAKILLDKEINNIDKLAICFVLFNLKIDHLFKIYNQHSQKTYDINCSVLQDLNVPNEQIIKGIQDVFLKDPSKQKMGMDLLNLLYGWYFPEKIPFNNQEIVNTIKNFIDNLFDDTTLNKNEITKILEDSLSHEKNS